MCVTSGCRGSNRWSVTQARRVPCAPPRTKEARPTRNAPLQIATMCHLSAESQTCSDVTRGAMWLSGVNQEQLGSLENEPFGVLRRREAVKQTFDAVPI